MSDSHRTDSWIVFALALCVRWLYVWDVSDSEFVRFLFVDSSAYHARALEILSGDWFGDRIFYQDPIYPYFLAGLYAVFGVGGVGVLLAQTALDAGTAVLIYAIAATLFGRHTALLAGSLAAVYAPFLFYGALVLKVTLSLFLMTLAIYAAVRARASPGLGSFWFVGVALGLACLTRGNHLVLIPTVLVWLALACSGPTGARRRAAVGFVAGLVLVLAPVALRNYAIGGDLVLVTSQAGQNFYIGNHRGNDTGTYRAPPFVTANPRLEERGFRSEARRRTGRELSPSELSRFWFREGLREIREDPAHFVRHTAHKTRVFFNAYEVPDNQDFQFFRREVSRLLALPLPGWGWLVPLACCGAWFARRNRGAWLLLLCFASYGATVVLFYNMSRYRIPLAPTLIVLASVGVTDLARAARRREMRTLLPIAGFLCLAYPAVLPPVMQLDSATLYLNLGIHLSREAESHQQTANEHEARSENDAAALERTTAREFRRRAEQQFRRGLEIRPRHRFLRPALRGMLTAQLLHAEQEGRTDEAVALARKLTSAYPELPAGYWHLGKNLREQGNLDTARTAFERTLLLQPRHAQALAALAKLRRDLVAPASED